MNEDQYNGEKGVEIASRGGVPDAFSAADVFPDFAVSPEEVKRRTRMLQEYVRNHMVEGEDYGIIPGGSKPTLFKPGAEKLNAVYGLSPVVEVTNRLENWDTGFVAYEVKVTLLNKRSGQIEAEGIGSCNSRERRYKNLDAAGSANTVLKMAKKRALVDATLSATRASGMFTQDLEDMDFEQDKSASQRGRNSRPNSRQAPGPGGARGDNGRQEMGRGNSGPSRQDGAGNGPRTASGAPGENGRGPAAVPGPEAPLSKAQLSAILGIAGRLFGPEARDTELANLVPASVEQLSRGEASALLSRLQHMAQNAPRPSQAPAGTPRSSPERETPRPISRPTS